LANPPFAGSLDFESTSGKLLTGGENQEKPSLLFMAPCFLPAAQTRWRGQAVIVPDGCCSLQQGPSELRARTAGGRSLLEGVVSLPSGVFRPYAGVSTAIPAVSPKTGPWRYRYRCGLRHDADGWSLDTKRNPLLAA